MNKKQSRFFLEFSHGSLSGKAVYVSEVNPEGSGTGRRVLGQKCYGDILSDSSFLLHLDNVSEFIAELQRIRRVLKRRSKEKVKGNL